MLYLKLSSLIEIWLYKFLKNITTSVIGSYLFYHIVLKGRIGINKIGFHVGKNLKILVRDTTNMLASRELKKLSDKSKNIEEIVDLGLSFRFCLSGIPPLLYHKIHLVSFQNKFEMIELLKLIENIQPKIILEIGTAMGGTLYLLSRFSASNAILISVDLPEVIVGGRKFLNNPFFFEKFIQKKQKIIQIRDDSHKFSTFQKIKQILKNRELDVLFIDGDHNYNGVKKDFEMYKTLVKHGGIVCFHDIVPGSHCDVGDVPDFWNKIREEYDSREIVKDWSQGGFGIGILFIN